MLAPRVPPGGYFYHSPLTRGRKIALDAIFGRGIVLKCYSVPSRLRRTSREHLDLDQNDGVYVL